MFNTSLYFSSSLKQQAGRGDAGNILGLVYAFIFHLLNNKQEAEMRVTY